MPTDNAFPPLGGTGYPRPPPSTPSTASETFDEDTIQSAISTAIKKLEEQHRAELSQLKTEMQKRIDAMEQQMKDLGQQVAVQTYQALVQEESPLATKTDHAILQHEISLMSTQLATIINLFQQNGHKASEPPNLTDNTRIITATTSSDASPPRTTKRSKFNLTPIKLNMLDKVFTQDQSVSSATSTQDEGMEGCEE